MRRREVLRAGVAVAAIGTPTFGAESSGQLLVVDAVGSSLDVYDRGTFARVGRVPLELRPREIVVPPSARVAYVSIYGPGVYGHNPKPGREIVAIDLETRKIAKKIGIGPHVAPHGMALAADGRFWVTCETEGALLLIDPASKSRMKFVAATVPVGIKGPHWIALSPDGAKLYATSRDNPILSVIDARERRLMREVKTPGGLNGLAIAPDGRRLFAASLSKASLWVIDAREDRVVREFALNEPATRLKTFDGGLIAAHESGAVEFFEVPGFRRRGTLTLGAGPSGIAIADDGKTAFVASFTEGTIAMIDLGTLRTIRTIKTGGGPDGIALVNR